MAVFMDIKGTSQQSFQIQKGGPRIKNVAGSLQLRNAGDTDYADFFAALMNLTGDSLVLNADATETGADFKIVIARPTSGMTSNLTFTLPTSAGTTGYVLQTDGAGNLSWVAQATTPSVTSKVTVETMTIPYTYSGSYLMFTLPANAIIHRVQVIIDTVFNGSPSLSVGISGNASKYMAASDSDLTSGAEDRWEAHPNKTASFSTESIEVTFSGGGASQGVARVLVDYSIPA